MPRSSGREPTRFFSEELATTLSRIRFLSRGLSGNRPNLLSLVFFGGIQIFFALPINLLNDFQIPTVKNPPSSRQKGFKQ